MLIFLDFWQQRFKPCVIARFFRRKNRGNPVNDAVINTKPQGFATAYRKNNFRLPERRNVTRLKRLAAFVLPYGKTGLPRQNFVLSRNDTRIFNF